MKLTHLLSAAAVVLLATACDSGGTRITAPGQARYDGGNFLGSGNYIAPTTGDTASTTVAEAPTTGTTMERGTNTFGSGN